MGFGTRNIAQCRVINNPHFLFSVRTKSTKIYPPATPESLLRHVTFPCCISRTPRRADVAPPFPPRSSRFYLPHTHFARSPNPLRRRAMWRFPHLSPPIRKTRGNPTPLAKNFGPGVKTSRWGSGRAWGNRALSGTPLRMRTPTGSMRLRTHQMMVRALNL